jgi:cardiolipin synthase
MRDAVDLAFAAAVIVAAAFASGHAVLYKRDSRSAALWLAVVWLLPALGPLLYLTIGVNRVERRATRLRRRMVRHRTEAQFPPGEPGTHFTPLARLVGKVVGRPLLQGNAVEPLIDGAHAYPAMLDAIGRALDVLPLAVAGQFDKAMQQLHTVGTGNGERGT